MLSALDVAELINIAEAEGWRVTTRCPICIGQSRCSCYEPMIVAIRTGGTLHDGKPYISVSLSMSKRTSAIKAFAFVERPGEANVAELIRDPDIAKVLDVLRRKPLAQGENA